MKERVEGLILALDRVVQDGFIAADYASGCKAYLKNYLVGEFLPNGEGECARDVRGFLEGSWTPLNDILEV